MSTPRRPTAGRRPVRPAARGRAGASRATVPRTTVVVAGRPPRPDEPGRRTLLTPRTAILALLAVGLLLSAALPLKEYIEQRGEIAALEAKQDAARERISALEAEKARLQDPAYLQAEARRRLHFVMPGETAYVVIAPERAAAPPTATEDADAPWWSQVWGSVREADRPATSQQ